MFLCPKCGQSTQLPTCLYCGFIFPNINNIYQMTDMDNLNLDPSKGIQYIGYDEIGLDFEPGTVLFDSKSNHYGVYESCSDKLVEYFGKNVVVLDLGAGLGSASIPLAKAGAHVIAVDISQNMLSLLLNRINNQVPSNLTCCRMNAFKLQIADQSIDVVVENAMLHLVDQPRVVIEEIKRVLKPNGALVRYGSPSLPGEPELYKVNELCNAALNKISHFYYQGINKYGFEEIWFHNHYNDIVLDFFNKPFNVPTNHVEEFTQKMKFRIHRLKTKAHSALQHVPNDIHQKVWEETEKYAFEYYGKYYQDIPSYSKYSSALDVYIKK